MYRFSYLSNYISEFRHLLLTYMLYFSPLYLWGYSYKKPCKLVILYFSQYYYYRIIMYNTHTRKKNITNIISTARKYLQRIL